jgi:predicted MFS family arabinose efflux permease
MAGVTETAPERCPSPDTARPGRPPLVTSRRALVTLAGAAFVYVTAETLPVGLVPQLSAGLHVRPGTVGLLVTVYAAMAGLSAIPLTATLEHRSRRQVVVGCVVLLALSQFLIAVAPDYAVVMAARVACALAHGVFWSMLPSVAARLVAPGRAGRATAMVFSGNSLALVFGVPVGTALGHVAGWRAAMATLGVAAVLVAVALRRALPALSPGPGPAPVPGLRARAAAVPAALRSAPLLAVCVITVLVVTGHFTAYTYITALVRSDARFTGLALSAVLFAYGAAGIGGIWLAGRITDRRPRRATAACALGVAVALTGLTTVAPGSAAVTVAAVIVWGAAFTALPVCLQAAVLRVAPRSADTASALYVVAFQIGIGGGALAGSLLVDTGVLSGLCVIGAALAAAGLLIVLTARRAFPSRPGRLLGDSPPSG